MKTLAFRSILVATDLTSASDEVIRAAAALSELTGAELHVIHVYELPVLPYASEHREILHFQQRISETRRELDAQVKRAIPTDRITVRARVAYGSAARAILEQASATSADLIVLGPHRARPVGDLFLGSTADRIIRTAAVPCLIVRDTLDLPLRNIVVPVDLSEPARGAIELALGWGAALGAAPGTDLFPRAALDVIHVIPRVYNMEGFSFDRAVIGPELHHEVEAVRQRVPGADNVLVREEVIWGDDPAEEIVQRAGNGQADLLVLATHGYGAVMRALIGSVSSDVARAAPCSVLLVPPPLWQEPSSDPLPGRAALTVPVYPSL